MPMYNVTWEIDIDASSPRSAAEFALAIQRSESSAIVFRVTDKHGNVTQVDLWEEGEDVVHKFTNDKIILEQGGWTDE